MKKFLLSIAIGPVQDFIAAARRTRDLWYGSWMLSEVSKAAAKALHDKGAELIFPCPNDAKADLAEGSDFNTANKLLVISPECDTPRELAAVAEKAAKDRWLKLAAEAKKEASDRRLRLHEDIWKSQINDIIEFYAAWVPLDKAHYKDSRERVERILAGRKALRDFIPAKGWEGFPKSSLDGARETVLDEPERDGGAARQRAFIRQGEHLDAVGLVKRLGGDPDKFVSLSRIAADPWIRYVSGTDEGKKLLSEISRQCNREFSSSLDKLEGYSAFSWEGEVLFLSRVLSMLHDKDYERWKDNLTSIEKLLKELKHKGFGEPDPYLAVLVADGDRVGKAISSLTESSEHQKFSKQLSLFAEHAIEIVRKHQGCTVYAGGDDVLAFLPLDMALEAAEELHLQFEKLMQKSGLFKSEDIPTLSVGISIGHCQEMLDDFIELGRKAEKKAKTGEHAGDERNGLAVSVTTRRSEQIMVRRRWDDKEHLKSRIEKWSNLLSEGEISDRLPYDLRALTMEYKAIEKNEKKLESEKRWFKDYPEVLKADTRRIIKRKRQKKGTAVSETHFTELLDTVKKADDLLTVAHEIIIARQICSALYGKEEQNAHCNNHTA